MLRLIVARQSYGGIDSGIHPTTTIHSFTSIDDLEAFLRTEESMCRKELIGYELMEDATIKCEGWTIEDFTRELMGLVNKHSIDNELNTADFILAQYITLCLQGLKITMKQRSEWHGTP